MRSRTIRLIGYPVAVCAAALTAWGRVLELADKGWRTPDMLFAALVLTIIAAFPFVFITEMFAYHIGEEEPRV